MLSKQLILVHGQHIPQSHRTKINPDINLLIPPDLFINVRQKIWPIYGHRLSISPYIRGITDRFHIITEPLNIECFEIILNMINSPNGTLIIKQFHELQPLLHILSYLQLHSLIQNLQSQLIREVSFGQIFPLLVLSYHRNLQQLFQLCMHQLQLEQFEQINYNKFSLLQCCEDFTLFQIVIRRHHRLKVMQSKIKGIETEIIAEVLRLYCKKYHYDSETLHQLNNKYVVPVSRTKIRQRSATINCLNYVDQCINQQQNRQKQSKETIPSITSKTINLKTVATTNHNSKAPKYRRSSCYSPQMQEQPVMMRITDRLSQSNSLCMDEDQGESINTRGVNAMLFRSKKSEAEQQLDGTSRDMSENLEETISRISRILKQDCIVASKQHIWSNHNKIYAGNAFHQANYPTFQQLHQ